MILIDDDTVEEPAADPTSAAAGTSMAVRPRRLRSSPQMRDLVRETRLHPKMLVAPLFVRPGSGVREPIAALPPHVRYSVDELVIEAERLAKLGIGGLLLFGLPSSKDATGTGAWSDDGIVQEALRALRERDLPLVLMADTCLCEYTDHGHCGVVTPDRSHRQRRVARAAGCVRGRPGSRRCGRCRAVGDDGWAGGRDPLRA